MIRLANAPCSWGVLEFGLDGETADCLRFLEELRVAGFDGTELGDWGYMPTDPDELEALLTAHDLPLLGGFVPVALADSDSHAAGVERALKTARLLAAVNPKAFVVLSDDNGAVDARTRRAGRVGDDVVLDEARWPTLTAAVMRIAQAVHAETGLRTVFHHHCAGWIETPGEVERLMADTDPDYVGLCFDTGHWTFAGGNAIEGLRRWRDRIWHVHFKDCEPGVADRSRTDGWDYFESVRNGVFCELGEGCVDFRAIVEELMATDYGGWIVVEQDVLPGMGSPLESATRNRDFLRSIGL